MTHAREPRSLLEALFDAALERVDGARVVAGALEVQGGRLSIDGRPVRETERLRVVAVGKAAASMAAAFETAAGERLAGGIVVTKDGHGLPLRKLRVREAGHPVPDARSQAAGREVLAAARAAARDEVLVVLLSGGASALLSLPLGGLAQAELAETTRLLLAAGADIAGLNTVRKHLTAVSGGRLLRATGAGRVEVLALSDVPGDAVDTLASGPCAADPTTYADAIRVLAEAGVLDAVPRRVRSFLEEGAAGRQAESVKPGDPELAKAHTRILARNQDALDGAAREARRRGIRSVPVSGCLRGEARRVGRHLAAVGLAAQRGGGSPCVLLAGGETTVTVRGPGCGGRSQELALAAALALAGTQGVALLAAGTDGSDGPSEAAGAFADGGTVARGRERGLEAGEALRRNDSNGFFAVEGGLLVTGPTRTNVMDVAFVWVGPEPRGSRRR